MRPNLQPGIINMIISMSSTFYLIWNYSISINWKYTVSNECILFNCCLRMFYYNKLHIHVSLGKHLSFSQKAQLRYKFYVCKNTLKHAANSVGTTFSARKYLDKSQALPKLRPSRMPLAIMNRITSLLQIVTERLQLLQYNTQFMLVSIKYTQ